MHKITGYRFIILRKKTLFFITLFIILKVWKINVLRNTLVSLMCRNVFYCPITNILMSGSGGSRSIMPLQLRGSKLISRGYFVRLNYFVVSISWVWNFFSWIFVGPKFFIVSISLSKFFSREYFIGNSWMYKWATK